MKRLFVYAMVLVLGLCVAQAQSVSELQKRKANALKQLEITNNLINENSKNKAKNITQLNVINAEIKQQQRLINSINSEISGMNRQMSKLRSEAGKLQKQLDDLKAEYAQLMYHSYFKKNKFFKQIFYFSDS